MAQPYNQSMYKILEAYLQLVTNICIDPATSRTAGANEKTVLHPSVSLNKTVTNSRARQREIPIAANHKNSILKPNLPSFLLQTIIKQDIIKQQTQ